MILDRIKKSVKSVYLYVLNLYPIICENPRNLWIEAVNPQSLTNEVCVLANESAYLTHHVEGKRQQAIGYIGTAGQSRL